mmetsp:Transcript_27465/g.53676  ORF Transcript_27465/g.53676 Transcript_27465/m.53676 type:complete len:297 (+) Transcript_27465:31-921(+)
MRPPLRKGPHSGGGTVVASAAIAALAAGARSTLLATFLGSKTTSPNSLWGPHPQCLRAQLTISNHELSASHVNVGSEAGGFPCRRASLFGALLLASATAAAAPAARAADSQAQTGGTPESTAELPQRSFVLDETNIIAPSTETYLDKVLRRLQLDTGLKVRVICPPAGLQNERTAFKEYLRPINREWGLDPSSLVIVAEARVKERTGRTLPLLTIQPGFRLQERFQYRMTQDFIIGTADRFGFPKTYEETGTDQAIKEATENIVAGLFSLVDNPKLRLGQPLNPEEVVSSFQRHGL